MIRCVRFPKTVSPKQGEGKRVVCFAATAREVAQIARVDRIGRNRQGKLTGFQRPQIASHVREIHDYLRESGAIMPTSIVLAFGGGAKVKKDGSFVIDVSCGPPGWVVDGQQRLSAALKLHESQFEFVVTAFVCENLRELRKQFILVNNTRPLAKTLIYELLPATAGLPHRLSDRGGAALLTETLNYHPESSLRGSIHQHTNPDGIIKDTIIQRLLLNSIQQGALRSYTSNRNLVDGGFRLVSDFFDAVQTTFKSDWEGHTPKTSRLLHGAGLIALGYVMDELNIRKGARRTRQFLSGLRSLIGKTHWTSGEWRFSNERRVWNSIQNTSSDYRLLSHHLVRIVRQGSEGGGGR